MGIAPRSGAGGNLPAALAIDAASDYAPAMPPPATSSRTARFARRRTQVLDIASEQISASALSGMTLTSVARAMGLDTSSVTYYFRRKDDLAAACFERALDWLADAAAKAAAAPDPAARVRHLLAAHIRYHHGQHQPGALPLALLSELGALDDAMRAPLDDSFRATVAVVRGYFDLPDDAAGRRVRAVRAGVLLASLFWLPAWIGGYRPADLARVEERLFDLLAHGLGCDRTRWEPAADAPEGEPEDAQQRFLHAATILINRHGYKGASVERIAAWLGVSTGSFYHHLANKDDLVVACFDRTFGLVAEAGERAAQRCGSEGDRLGAMMAMLMAQQLGGACPLLRGGAYQALPPPLRERMLLASARNTRHVAGMVADGIADGSLRAVDPLIAAHLLLSAVDAAIGYRRDGPASTGDREESACLLESLSHGILPTS